MVPRGKIVSSGGLRLNLKEPPNQLELGGIIALRKHSFELTVRHSTSFENRIGLESLLAYLKSALRRSNAA
jgi:hypothetical protein